jgi:protein FrlC
MKYSFCSITYGSCGSWIPAYTLEETMKRLSNIGYDGLEVVTAAPHAWPYYLNTEKRGHIAEMFKENNLEASAVMPYMGGGPGCNVATKFKKERDWTVSYLKEVVDMAAVWGSKIVPYMAGWMLYGDDKKEAWNNSVDCLRQVASYAKGKGITVCIQQSLSQSNVVDSPDDARYMMQEAGVSNVALMFDVMSAVVRKQDPADYVYMMGKDLKAIHVCDYNRQAPGTAGLDFKQLYIALKEIGYDGYVTVEVGASRAIHADSVARKSLDYLKALEAKI